MLCLGGYCRASVISLLPHGIQLNSNQKKPRLLLFVTPLWRKKQETLNWGNLTEGYKHEIHCGHLYTYVSARKNQGQNELYISSIQWRTVIINRNTSSDYSSQIFRLVEHVMLEWMLQCVYLLSIFALGRNSESAQPGAVEESNGNLCGGRTNGWDQPRGGVWDQFYILWFMFIWS